MTAWMAQPVAVTFKRTRPATGIGNALEQNALFKVDIGPQMSALWFTDRVAAYRGESQRSRSARASVMFICNIDGELALDSR
jgi:hypothetical protein